MKYCIHQYLTDCFCRHWMREYLPSLTERRKWLRGQNNLNVGDIVIVIEPDTPRGEWPIDRVIKVFSCPYGIVRIPIVCLRPATKTSELHSPAVKVCLLSLGIRRMRRAQSLLCSESYNSEMASRDFVVIVIVP